MIRRFFQASSMGDNITMANIATVAFDPNKDGRAQNVSFVSETPAQTRELKIKDLDKAFKDAQAAESDYSKKMKEYQDKNIDAINRVIKIEQSGKGKPGGKDAEVQAAWTKWRDDQKAEQKKVSEARKALQAERKVADLSLPDHDITTFDIGDRGDQGSHGHRQRPDAGRPVGQEDPRAHAAARRGQGRGGQGNRRASG